MTDWPGIRSRFPHLGGRVFLNTATAGVMSRASTEAVLRHLERTDQVLSSSLLECFTDMDRVRGKIAQLIGAEGEDIALSPSTAHGLSILLNGIDWKTGDRIVTFDNEFPDSLYGASWLARKGVEVVKIPIQHLEAHLDKRVRLVLISALNYTTGLRAPVADLRARLDRVGALLYVDATQGCGVIELDMRTMQPDFLAVHGYKWMLSPTGAGFVYVRPSVRQWLEPNIIGWRSHVGWREFAKLHEGTPELAQTAERYEACMPSFPVYYALEQSIDLMLELTPAAIEKRALELSGLVRAGVVAMGGTVANLNTPLLACSLPGVDAGLLAKKLAEQKILVAARQGMLRVSLHFYNDEGDVAQFLGELRRF